jgi:hypothetical protein
MSNKKPQNDEVLTSKLKIPCSPPEADRESPKCKEGLPLYCSSLANLAASCEVALAGAFLIFLVQYSVVLKSSIQTKYLHSL